MCAGCIADGEIARQADVLDGLAEVAKNNLVRVAIAGDNCRRGAFRVVVNDEYLQPHVFMKKLSDEAGEKIIQ